MTDLMVPTNQLYILGIISMFMGLFLGFWLGFTTGRDVAWMQWKQKYMAILNRNDYLELLLQNISQHGKNTT